ncbi:MAG: magnesium transporter [Candidatus Thermoplasmatota archaeon]|nr:magnesium transporter [Candidatus Thermoplasmatota archaeon]
MVMTGPTRVWSSALIPVRTLVQKVRRKFPEGLKPDVVLLRQAILVLVFCGIIDLFPGYFLGRFEHILASMPGLLIILPPTVGLRGNIFGALAARIGSKLHLGTIEPRFRGNKELRIQLVAAAVQLLFLSIFIPVLAEVVGRLLHISIGDVEDLIFISILAALISGVLMFAITFGVSFLTFKRGWDPDNVSTPIVATSGDLLTVPVLFLCASLVMRVPDTPAVLLSGSALIVVVLISIYMAARGRGESREVLKEALPVAMIAVLISTFSGLVLGASFDVLLTGTIFLIMVPAINGQGGNMGSVLGSRVTSSAYLGHHRLSFRPNDLAVASGISLWLISLVVFVLVIGGGGVLLGLLTGMEIPHLLDVLVIMVLGATLITIVTSTVAYYIAFFSFKLGLDPDNVVIPILTAFMDVVGTGSLIIVLLMISVLS